MVEKFKIKYDDYGCAFINAKDIYDALEVKSVNFKTWWKDMVEDTGYRKSFDYIVCDKKFYVTPEMAQYFCRKWNFQVAYKNNCVAEIIRGYQVADLVEATEHFAKSECLIECAGCDEGIINAIKNHDELGEYKPFIYKEKPFNVFVYSGKPFFIVEEICRILEISNVKEALEHVNENDKSVRNNVLGVNENGVFDLIYSSRSPEARDFHIWFIRDVLLQLGAGNDD